LPYKMLKKAIRYYAISGFWNFSVVER